LYVLPYGQMSLWGATVITNLLSAIPWIGQDIVESINAIYYINTNMSYLHEITNELNLLPIIGTINPLAMKHRMIKLSYSEYLSIPKDFIAFFVGFIDGDGYIRATKTEENYIGINMVISLNIKDLSSLTYIQSVLNIGKIYTYYDRKNPCCKLSWNKTELQKIIFPLLVYHNIYFLTETRTNQFNKAMHIMKNNIKFYSEIGTNIPIVFKQPTNAIQYTELSFFKNWIVGFTASEGSFCIKNNNDACYQLKQIVHVNLFNAFKSIFETDRKITIDQERHMQFSVSSKKDIQTVINFFSFSGNHPLIGLKLIQYQKWLDNLRNSYRYKNLKYPN